MPPVDFTLNLQSDEVARGTQSVEYPDDMSSWAVTNIFSQRNDDDELDSSQDDQLFLNMMNEGARVTKEGHVELPLPLKPGVSLPDNRFSVLKRTELLSYLTKDTVDAGPMRGAHGKRHK